jgi:hypothetical protein
MNKHLTDSNHFTNRELYDISLSAKVSYLKNIYNTLDNDTILMITSDSN